MSLTACDTFMKEKDRDRNPRMWTRKGGGGVGKGNAYTYNATLPALGDKSSEDGVWLPMCRGNIFFFFFFFFLLSPFFSLPPPPPPFFCLFLFLFFFVVLFCFV